jgi:6-phosphogluconolactonase
MAQVIRCESEARFITEAVRLLSAAVEEGISKNGRAIVGLSGGSTPKPVYQAWGEERLDWMRVWIFLIDERYVPPDNPKSNQFLLRTTLLKGAPIPESHMLLPDTSLPLEQCVNAYDAHLRDLLKTAGPDIVTLGMGDDGHIASLFPPLRDDAFGPRLVTHTTTDRFDAHDRISVTIPAVKQAKNSVFLLKGAEKKRVWDEMLESKEDERRWPAKTILENATALIC